MNTNSYKEIIVYAKTDKDLDVFISNYIKKDSYLPYRLIVYDPITKSLITKTLNSALERLYEYYPQLPKRFDFRSYVYLTNFLEENSEYINSDNTKKLYIFPDDNDLLLKLTELKKPLFEFVNLTVNL